MALVLSDRSAQHPARASESDCLGAGGATFVLDPAELQRAIEPARGSEDQPHIELESQQQSLQDAQGTIARLIDLLGNSASLSAQRPMQKKLNELTKHREQSPAWITELESRLAERGQGALGLRQLFQQ
jgi:hypothetical protein